METLWKFAVVLLALCAFFLAACIGGSSGSNGNGGTPQIDGITVEAMNSNLAIFYSPSDTRYSVVLTGMFSTTNFSVRIPDNTSVMLRITESKAGTKTIYWLHNDNNCIFSFPAGSSWDIGTLVINKTTCVVTPISDPFDNTAVVQDTAPTANLYGMWYGTRDDGEVTVSFDMFINQDGHNLTGNVYADNKTYSFSGTTIDRYAFMDLFDGTEFIRMEFVYYDMTYYDELFGVFITDDDTGNILVRR